MRLALWFITLQVGICLSINLHSQCIPDSTISELYSPSGLQGIPPAMVGIIYETVIHINVPTDTLILNNPVHIDSLIIQEIEGIPSELSFECNSKNCVFLGGEFGCTNLSGLILDETQVGTHPLVIKFVFYTSVGPALTHNVTDYSLVVESGYTTGISESGEKAFSIKPLFDPLGSDQHLLCTVPATGAYSFSIYSLLGAEVFSIQSSTSENEFRLPINKSRLQAGIYFATLSQEGRSETVRFSVQ